jgi:hypothetical protein
MNLCGRVWPPVVSDHVKCGRRIGDNIGSSFKDF